MSPDDQFPPVDLLSNLEPWESPQYIPGAPHNLPPRLDRPGARIFSPASLPSALTPPPSDPGGSPVPVFDKHHYTDLNGEQVIAVGVASVLVLAESSTKRNMLGFRNSSTGANVIYIAFGTNATTLSWLSLDPGEMLLLDSVVPQDEVYAISDLAAGSLTVVAGSISYES